MNNAQRELLAKGLADVAKGVVIAAPIAMGTGKLSVGYTLSVIALAVALFNIAYGIAGGDDHD